MTSLYVTCKQTAWRLASEKWGAEMQICWEPRADHGNVYLSYQLPKQQFNSPWLANSLNGNADVESDPAQRKSKSKVKFYFGISPDFSVQLKVLLSESLSKRLCQKLKWLTELSTLVHSTSLLSPGSQYGPDGCHHRTLKVHTTTELYLLQCWYKKIHTLLLTENPQDFPGPPQKISLDLFGLRACLNIKEKNGRV